jgi:hypothetical protein
MARVAPSLAGAGLAAALAGRLTGAPPALAGAVLAGLLAALAGLFFFLRRSTATPDATAARVDADAALGGELRSAHWFARHPEQNDWTDYHLARAAERAGAVDWSTLYPPVRATRSWLLAGAGLVAAAVLAVTTPGPGAAAPAVAAAADLRRDEVLQTLPPELLAQLEDLLKQMAQAGEAGDLAEASLEELREMMKEIDPALAARLAELAKDALEAARAQGGEKPAEADLAKNSNAGLPEDVRWAVDDLAERLANASRDRQTNQNNPSASEETGEMGAGSEQAASAQGANAEAQMSMMREAATDAGAAKMMMGGAGAMGGDSRPGAGGNNGAAAGTGIDPLSIAQALRQELLEASADTRGKNVEREDLRRKTEQGDATVGFSRVAAPSSTERSRAQAPPEVPDARRALLHTYFTRQR